MGSNFPGKPHFIPNMLLKHFCDDGGQLSVGDIGRGKIYQKNPKGAFIRRHIYTRYTFGHPPTKSAEYESILGRIENDAAHAVCSIIEQARNGKCPELSPEHNVAFKRFAIALARRTPESQERVSSGKNRDAYYEAAKDRAKELNYDLPDRATLYRDPRILKHKERVESNVNAQFSAGDTPHERDQAERFCREVGLRVAVICLPRRSFVIGSHGITIRQPHNTSGSSGPMRGSLVPIAHDVIVQITPFPDKENLLCLDQGSDSLIKAINRDTAAQSRIIAGRSEALVRSLMRG